jgi:predicted aspartyl protease
MRATWPGSGLFLAGALALWATPSVAAEAIALSRLADGRMIADARAEAGALRMILDTGATRTALSIGGAERLAVAASRDRVALLRGVSGTLAAPVFRVPRLALGGRQVAARDAPGLSVAEADGVIGADVLRTGAPEFDFRRDMVVLHAAAPAASVGWAAAPVEVMANGLVRLTLTVNGAPVRALLDTGAARSVANPALAARLSCGAPSSSLAGSEGGRIAARACLPAELAIAGHVAQVALTAAPAPLFADLGWDEAPGLILGMDALEGGRFVLDYAAGALRTAPILVAEGASAP